MGLLTVVVLLAVFGPFMAPKNPLRPYAMQRDTSGEWHRHPFRPLEMPGFPLGTDYERRDVLSRLLWAFRPTLVMALLAGLARLGLGTALGLVSGWSTGRAGSSFGAVAGAAAAVPVLIVAILVLYVAGPNRTQTDFVVALSLTGWAPAALLVATRVRALRDEAYVDAARALGAGGPQLVRRHVLPHLALLLPILFSFEVAAVLLTLAELGFLGFFIGGGVFRSVPSGLDPSSILSLVQGQPELSQMMSSGWDAIFRTPWLMLWVGLLFVLVVMCFMLIGEGLKRRLDPYERAAPGLGVRPAPARGAVP
jgi:ABC-type dipeptide/oligopeptide/nickel transport system permease subunit